MCCSAFTRSRTAPLANRISINTNSQSAVKPRDLRSNDRVMVGLKKAFETRYVRRHVHDQAGRYRLPANKDQAKVLDAATFAKMLMAWQCQTAQITLTNEKKLFDEYYKTLFKTGYSPESMLTLQQWLNAIEAALAESEFEQRAQGRQDACQVPRALCRVGPYQRDQQAADSRG